MNHATWRFIWNVWPLLLTLITSAGCEETTRKWVQPRSPQQRSERLKEEDAENTKSGQFQPVSNEFLSSGKQGHFLRFLTECNVLYKMDEGDMVVIHSSHCIMDYNCIQRFEVLKEGLRLKLICSEICLKYDCDWESLIVETNDTIFEACGPSMLNDIYLTGSFFILNFTRRDFMSHGGYTCAVIASKEVYEGNGNYTNLPYLDCRCCGKTEKDKDDMCNRKSDRSAPMTRIVGGEERGQFEDPWQVYIEIFVEGSDLPWACGGSLLSKRIVVTAAHCFENGVVVETIVILGIINLNNPDQDYAEEITAESYHMHPNYDTVTLRNDITIIILESDVQFTNAIQPICLPSLNLGNIGEINDVPVRATGWGQLEYGGDSSEKLQSVVLQIWNSSKCVDAWKSELNHDIVIDSPNLCAYGNGKDACGGDSGGPLVFEKDGHNILVGLTSYGYRCAEDGIPGVYTNVLTYIDWILGFMNDECFVPSTTYL